MDKPVRLFIALEIPEEIRSFIWREISSALRKHDIVVSWVRRDNMHITLKFLGDTQIDLIPSIIDSLDCIFSRIGGIQTQLGEAGTFGGRNPKVIWIAPEGGIDKMSELALSVDNALVKHGFGKEKRIFSPHITLGRVRNSKNSAQIKGYIEALDYPKIKFAITKAVLMKSQLTKQGAIYEPVCEWNLT